MAGQGGGWAARFVRLVLAFPARGELRMCPGRVREGLGGGGGEGDFSPAAAAFQRHSQATWEGGREGGEGKEPPPGQPQAHLQENSGWDSAGNCSDPLFPCKTRPFPDLTAAWAAWRTGGPKVVR